MSDWRDTFIIPTSKRMPLFVAGQEEVPWALRGYVAGAFGRGAINVSEIGHIFGGRAAMPTKPIMVYGPDSRVITLVVGGGEAEAAELEEMAYAAIDKNETRMKKDKSEMFGHLRSLYGLPDRAQSQAMQSQALRDHGRDKIANPSKYPKRKPADRSWIKRLPEIPV